MNGSNQLNNSVSNQVSSPTIDENSILRGVKKKKKWPVVLLLILSIVILSFGIFLLIKDRKEYNNYVVIGADLENTTKIYEAGRPYYIGRYSYVVNNKKYYYNYSKKFEGNPDKVIRVKYNSKNPSKLYDSNIMIYYIIGLSIGFILFIVSIGLLLSITSKTSEKIVEVVVYDILTCVGGRKIFMKTTNLDIVEYYSYFTNKIEYFPIGRKIKFNLYKYKEVFLTEQYKGVNTSSINDFNLEDFIFMN